MRKRFRINKQGETEGVNLYFYTTKSKEMTLFLPLLYCSGNGKKRKKKIFSKQRHPWRNKIFFI